MKHNPLSGINYIKRGFILMLQPGAKRYVIIPLLINIIVFTLFIGVGYHYIGVGNAWLDSHLAHWLHWLKWLVWLVFIVGSLFFVVYLFTIVANIIASPFNGFLSEKIEQMIRGKKNQDDFKFKQCFSIMLKAIERQGRFLLYYLPRAVILLILFFIPGVNIIAGVLWFLFTAWMMTLQYLDYPFDNHHIGFKPMIKAMHKERLTNLNFGIVVTVLSSIPIVNLFIIPAAVAGATAIWVEHYQKNQKHQSELADD
jgi:CysZ protein